MTEPIAGYFYLPVILAKVYYPSDQIDGSMVIVSLESSEPVPRPNFPRIK